jgi:hypothetical protein
MPLPLLVSKSKETAGRERASTCRGLGQGGVAKLQQKHLLVNGNVKDGAPVVVPCLYMGVRHTPTHKR